MLNLPKHVCVSDDSKILFSTTTRQHLASRILTPPLRNLLEKVYSSQETDSAPPCFSADSPEHSPHRLWPPPHGLAFQAMSRKRRSTASRPRAASSRATRPGPAPEAQRLRGRPELQSGRLGWGRFFTPRRQAQEPEVEGTLAGVLTSLRPLPKALIPARLDDAGPSSFARPTAIAQVMPPSPQSSKTVGCIQLSPALQDSTQVLQSSRGSRLRKRRALSSTAPDAR